MISVERVRASVPQAASITDDTVIADMVARAVATVERVTRRYFGEAGTVTEYLKGSCSYDLYLAERALSLDSDEPGVGVIERCHPSTTSNVITAFEVREAETFRSILHRFDGPVWGSGYEYAVTYTRGYAVDGLPPDIEGLVLDLLALRINAKGKEGLKSETIGGYSYTRGDASEGNEVSNLPGAMDIVRAWRRIAQA